MYYKVVDSDDWLDTAALAKVMEKLREFSKSGFMVSFFRSRGAARPLQCMRAAVQRCPWGIPLGCI